MKDLLCDTDSVLITAVLFVSITISKETPMLTVSFARIRAEEGTRHEQQCMLPGANGAVRRRCSKRR
jgi:hypothetical protein